MRRTMLAHGTRRVDSRKTFEHQHMLGAMGKRDASIDLRRQITQDTPW